MATIVTRSGKGSPLTNNEVDANFTNLNTDKAELSGATFTGEIVANAGIALGDNDKATFGAGNDLQIYSDGTDGYIDNVTGDFYIRDTTGGTLHIQGKSGEESIVCHDDGGVDLYRNNALKLATTSSGIDVTGTATMDGLDINSAFSTAYFRTSSTSTNYRLANGGDGSFSIIETNGLNYVGQRLNIADGGDISFYEDTGTTPKLFWDASAESLTVDHRIKVGSTADGIALQIDTGVGSILGVDTGGNGWNDLDIRAGSATQLYLDTSGNVGIGESNPLTWKLHVKSADSNALRLFNSAGSGNTIDFVDQGWQSQIHGNAGSLLFKTGGTNERMRIDSSGRVGIGTSSPSSYDGNADNLVIGGDSAVGLTLASSATNGRGSIYFADGASGDQKYRGTVNYFHDSDALTITTAAAERMRIDSSGNLLVGHTSAEGDSSGTTLYQNGQTVHKADGAYALELVRSTSDGDIAVFRKDSAVVGSIGSYLGAYAYIGSTGGIDTHIAFVNGSVRPATATGAGLNDTLDLGNTGSRFKDLYLSGKASVDTLQFAQNSGAAGATEAVYRPTTGQLAFKANSTERMRIDSGGSLLIGQTVGNVYNQTSVTGLKLDGPNGNLQIARANNPTLLLNRNGTDGDLALFFKNGLGIGSIGSQSGHLYISGNGTNSAGLRLQNNGIISPTTNAAISGDTVDIGQAGARFKDLYLSGGVYLGGTGSANKLDDYEEGTFTPIVKGTTTDGTATYAHQVGEYTKVGRHVTVQVYINWTSGTGAGALQISGLPFSSLSGTGRYNSPSYGEVSNIPYTAGRMLGGLLAANTTILNVTQSAPSATPLVVPYVSSGYLLFNLTYIANA